MEQRTNGQEGETGQNRQFHPSCPQHGQPIYYLHQHFLYSPFYSLPYNINVQRPIAQSTGFRPYSPEASNLVHDEVHTYVPNGSLPIDLANTNDASRFENRYQNGNRFQNSPPSHSQQTLSNPDLAEQRSEIELQNIHIAHSQGASAPTAQSQKPVPPLKKPHLSEASEGSAAASSSGSVLQPNAEADHQEDMSVYHHIANANVANLSESQILQRLAMYQNYNKKRNPKQRPEPSAKPCVRRPPPLIPAPIHARQQTQQDDGSFADSRNYNYTRVEPTLDFRSGGFFGTIVPETDLVSPPLVDSNNPSVDDDSDD